MSTAHKRVLFYTDAGVKEGVGHLRECLVLKKKLYNSGGIGSSFITPTRTALMLNSTLKESDVMAIARSDAAIIRAAQQYAAVIFNAARMPSRAIRALRSMVPTIVITEHTNECVGTLNINVARDPASMIIDAVFLTARKKYRVRKKMQSIVIAFGGSDPQGLTVAVLETLCRSGKTATVNIIVGALFKHTVAVQKLSAAYAGTVKIHSSLSPLRVAQLFQHADIAITAGGDMMYELAIIGVPFIVCPPLSKQRRNAQELLKGLKASTIQKILCTSAKKNMRRALPKAVSWLSQYIVRKKLSEQLRRKRIGYGADVVSEKISQLIELRATLKNSD